MQERKESSSKPDWKEESFYFGNANWPSWVHYRSNGERMQLRIEEALPLTKDVSSNQYTASLIGLREFIETYEDCRFIVADGYDTRDGKHEPPYLWIIGWKELTTAEERQQYEEDKRLGSFKPA